VSITLGIYDVFSYAIPGILYLFSFNEGLRLLRLPFIDISQLNSTSYLVLLVLLSYLVGHLFDYISHYIWYRRFYPGKSEERAFSRFKVSSGVMQDFKPQQWSILLSVIRHDNTEVCNSIDKNKATSIMLRNVSFALFLLSIVFVISAFISGFSLIFLLGAIATLISSIIALRRGDVFNQWFYMLIYQQSLIYGKSLKEVLNNNRLKTIKKRKTSSRLEKKR
jgi:MFS family permease